MRKISKNFDIFRELYGFYAFFLSKQPENRVFNAEIGHLKSKNGCFRWHYDI